MLTTQTANIGDTVKFKLWVRPNRELTGKVVKIEKDSYKNKPAKYIIKPDEKVPELPHETTYRFHPYTKPSIDLNTGKPNLDEEGREKYEYPVGIMEEDITDIIPANQ